MIHWEDNEAKSFWQWAQHQKLHGVCDAIYAIPNGGKRNAREAARMKGHGVRAGVSDYFLMLGCGRYNGLYIELKAARPHNAAFTREQKIFARQAVKNGYAFRLAIGWIEAAAAIRDYCMLAPGMVDATFEFVDGSVPGD